MGNWTDLCYTCQLTALSPGQDFKIYFRLCCSYFKYRKANSNPSGLSHIVGFSRIGTFFLGILNIR